MEATVKLLAIADQKGNIIAAQYTEQDADPKGQEAPTGEIFPLKGQRKVTIDVPRELLELPGPDLYRYLSHLTINWPAGTGDPKIELISEKKS